MDGRRLALAGLLLSALIFRALIPAGWMPNLQAGGGAPLVICTAAGAELLHAPGPSHPGGHSGSRHDACPFGALAASPAPAPSEVAAPLALAQGAALQPSDTAAAATPRRRGEQTARGPPLQA